MKHKTLVANIKDAIEHVEYKDGRPTRLGDMGSQKSSKSRVIVREAQPLVTTSLVPIVQEVANEIMQQMNLNQRPPMRIEPL